MMMAEFFMIVFTIVLLIFAFFVFDDIILKGYFATKLRMKYNVENLK